MIRIITDSTSDISKERQRAMNIDICPLEVNFGAERYRDGVDITVEEFYRKLEVAKTLPTTSLITPYEFTTLFQKYIDAEDEVVGIFLSSYLSGTFQSAMTAREINPSRIHVVDSRNVTFGLALLVQEAVRLRNMGATAKQIAEAVKSMVPRMRLIAVVNTLKYLKLGGRISAATAVVGEFLGISPIISVVDGKVESIGKTRGKRAAFRWMLERLQQDPPDAQFTVAFGHSNAPELLDECMEFFAPYVNMEGVLAENIGSTVGTHAGPGAVGIAYIAKEA